MRHHFIATATMAVLLATGAFPDRAGAADVVPSPYGPPPAYGPQPGYGPRDDYGPPPAYGQPPVYTPQPGYGPPDDYGPPSDYGPPPRPPHAIPYGAASPVRPACDMQWRCAEGFAGPGACGWRRVCYRRSAEEVYARPYRGYGPSPGPRYYGPY